MYDIPSSNNITFEFNSPAVYKLLFGTSNNITSIWADSNASKISGKMYVTSNGSGAAFSILDLKTKSLYDRYTLVLKGRANETLVQEDIKDLIVSN